MTVPDICCVSEEYFKYTLANCSDKWNKKKSASCNIEDIMRFYPDVNRSHYDDYMNMITLS
jgi:hypothetical protein